MNYVQEQLDRLYKSGGEPDEFYHTQREWDLLVQCGMGKVVDGIKFSNGRKVNITEPVNSGE